MVFALASTDLFDVVDGNAIVSTRQQEQGFQIGMDEGFAAEVVARLCSVVSWCWKRGVVHRDIKLENILFLHPRPTPPVQPESAAPFLSSLFLSDFGLAALIPSTVVPHTSKAQSVTELSQTTLSFITPYAGRLAPSAYDTPPPSPTGDLSEEAMLRGAVGSPHFAAPEVVHSPMGYTKQVDAWSIGVVAYMCVGGGYCWPFGELSEKQLVPEESKLAQGADFTHPSLSSTSPNFQRFVNSLLHPDPSLRLTPRAALDHDWIRTMVEDDVRMDLIGWSEGRDPDDWDGDDEETDRVSDVGVLDDMTGLRRIISGQHPGAWRLAVGFLLVGILLELLIVIMDFLDLGSGNPGDEGQEFWKAIRARRSAVTINSLLTEDTLAESQLPRASPANSRSNLAAEVDDSSLSGDPNPPGDGVDMTVNTNGSMDSPRTSASTPFTIPKKHKSRLHPTPYIFTAPLFPSNEHHSFFIVSDGHRGNRVAHYLSRRIHWRVASMDEFERGEYGEALRLGFMAVEQELHKAYSTVLRGKEPAGSTCCAALITDDRQLFVANVGDSRAVLSCAGVAVPMSFDHKPNIFEESQRIHRAGSMIIDGRVQGGFCGSRPHTIGRTTDEQFVPFRDIRDVREGRLATSRSFGDFDFKRNRDLPLEEQAVTAKPEVLRKQLIDADEFLVVCSDGVFDVLTSESIIIFVRSRIAAGLPLPRISEEVLDYCVAARPSRADVSASAVGGTDNMTCIIVAFLFGRSWEEFVDEIRARYGAVDADPVVEIDPATGQPLPTPIGSIPSQLRPVEFVAINPRRKTDREERPIPSGGSLGCCGIPSSEDDVIAPHEPLPAGVADVTEENHLHESEKVASPTGANGATIASTNGTANGHHIAPPPPMSMVVPIVAQAMDTSADVMLTSEKPVKLVTVAA
ncbi:Protein phosphatase 2C 2 [Gonapodya sp. JEL0774]|nr:Protein phosphatase 2C 2 [Gonapodya sp. JEL0774]